MQLQHALAGPLRYIAPMYHGGVALQVSWCASNPTSQRRRSKTFLPRLRAIPSIVLLLHPCHPPVERHRRHCRPPPSGPWTVDRGNRPRRECVRDERDRGGEDRPPCAPLSITNIAAQLPVDPSPVTAARESQRETSRVLPAATKPTGAFISDFQPDGLPFPTCKPRTVVQLQIRYLHQHVTFRSAVDTARTTDRFAIRWPYQSCGRLGASSLSISTTPCTVPPTLRVPFPRFESRCKCPRVMLLSWTE